MKTRSFKQYFEQLTLVYYAMIAPTLVLFALVYLPIKDGGIISTPGTAGIKVLYLCGALLLVLIPFAARRRFRNKITELTPRWHLSRKLSHYRKHAAVFYGYTLLASLLAIGLLYFTRYALFVGVYPVLLLIISLFRPTVPRLIRELPLSEEELATIKNDGQITNDIG